MIDLKDFRGDVGYVVVVNSIPVSKIQLPFDYTIWDALDYVKQVPRYIGLLYDGHVLYWKKGYLASN